VRARASGSRKTLHDAGDRITEVLLARICVRPHVAFDFGEQLLLERLIFEHSLDHIVGLGTAAARSEVGRTPLHGGEVVAEIPEIGENARLALV